MAYTKLPKVRSDYVLGYQTLNIAKANQEAHRDAWLNKHGEEESIPGRPGNPARLLGHHSDDRIPRDVLRVRCESPGSFGAVFRTEHSTVAYPWTDYDAAATMLTDWTGPNARKATDVCEGRR